MSSPGPVWVITGATSGIGRIVAERRAAEGARVVLAGRRQEAGEAVAAGIRAAGGGALFLQVGLVVMLSCRTIISSQQFLTL